MTDVVAIIGPTASGKTDLSIGLAKRLDGEIINGDSMQVYRRLDVGTAKITAEEMDGVPHHLIDILEPGDSFSVADYQRLVRGKIEEIRSRGKLPIIVGGTGLYVQAVLFDFRFAERKTDPGLRRELERDLEKTGPEAMHRRLMALDPDASIHPNNTRRVLRALEILLSGGSLEDGSRSGAPVYDAVIFGLDVPRDILYERINARVARMIGSGILQEAEWLMDEGLENSQAARAIGYRELISFLQGDLSREAAIELLKKIPVIMQNGNLRTSATNFRSTGWML